ncbi:hypothetical protein K435DRAFT_963951 [Dendrothele bispora CBS 962.96]|uniref:Uncharacterized protein n=1 Tax=Dendrothele bispora (strain CBS 962.96) TaxID=1314807 RepID=A0A4S8MD92_DENBC|nr:hypothetical protein K435DRAFT_963951 [Dendrothele bispora CBS 962.96]
MASFFDNASDFSISNSTITSIPGDQTVNIVNFRGPSNSLGSSLRPSIDVQSVPLGKLKLLKLVSREVVNGEHDFKHRSITSPREAFRFEKIVHRARVRGISGISDCSVVKYEGVDKDAAWFHDLKCFSERSSPNVSVLFGLNKTNRLLIFNEDNELIPIIRLWSKGSSLIRCYLEYCVSVDMRRVFNKFGEEFVSETLDITGGVCVRRDTGLICAAPWHRSNSLSLTSKLIPHESLENSSVGVQPLRLGSYNDGSEVLLWFRNDFPYDFHLLIGSLIPGYGVERVPIKTLLPLTVGSVVYIDRESNNVEPDLKTMKLGLFRNVGLFHPSKLYFNPGTLMANGWTRITRNQLWRYPSLNRPLMHVLTERSLDHAWLSQAHFLHSTTLQGSLENYVLFDRINLGLVPIPTSMFRCKPWTLPENLYLFVAPVITKWSTHSDAIEINWGKDGDFYYWSLDAIGSVKLSEASCEFLGLPEFRGELRCRTWEKHHYEAVKEFQLALGHDPRTRDYAETHNFPILDIFHSQNLDEPEISHDPTGSEDSDEDSCEWYDVLENSEA